MKLTKAQKKFIKENYKELSSDLIAQKLGIPERLVTEQLRETKRVVRKGSSDKISTDGVSTITSFAQLKQFVLTNLQWVLLIAEVGIVVYINSLGGGFISDDIPSFQESPLVRSISTLFTDFPRHFHVQMFWYIFAYKIFGLSVIPLHLMSVFSHIIAGISAYIFVSMLFNKRIGILSAILFVVHPITTESVSWISGVFYIWSTIVVLWTSIFYLMFRRAGNKKYLYISLIIYLCCLVLVRQPWLIVVPAFICAIDFFILDQKLVFTRFKTWLPYFVLAGFFFIYTNFLITDRIAFLKGSPEFNYEDASPYYMSTSYTIAESLRYYLYPNNLTFYHEGDVVQNYIYVVTIVFLAVFAISIFKFKKLAFLQAFFIISVLLSLSPIRVAWYMAERYLYFGTISYAIFLATFIIALERKIKIQRLSVILGIVIVLLFSIRTIMRNVDWENQDKLWISTVKVSPYSPKVHNNLGDVFFRAGDYNKALGEFKTAVALSPMYSAAIHNMGSVYLQLNQLDAAKERFIKSLEYDPNLFNSYYKLGYIAKVQGNNEEARAYFSKTLEIVPDYMPAKNALLELDTSK